MSHIPQLPPRPLRPYQSLPPDSLRFLRVYPGAMTDPLVCSLQVAPLARLPDYEALSYCWGAQATEDASPSILVDGFTFKVTPNLHGALLRLRLRDQPRLLWVDAVCINQEDILERNSQVTLMDQIYRRAKSVVVWLGEAILVDGKDVWSIPPLVEAARKNLKRTDLPIRNGTKDWIKYVLSNDWTSNGDLQNKKWNAIIKGLILMLQRPWFLRTWVIQEAALARDAILMCGEHSATWADFYRAISYAIDLSYFSSTAPEMYSSTRSIERARGLLANSQYQRPLDLLASFQIFLATNPRDKVFGIYGLFSSSDRAAFLKQDYDIDTVDVYTQSAIDCITMEQNLDVLSLGGQDCLPAHTKLPTWAPDWAYSDRAKPLHPRFLSALSYGGYQLPPRSATGNSPLVFHVSDDKKILTLSGYVLDRIMVTGGVMERDYYESQPGHPLLDTNLLIQRSIGVFHAWEDICGVTENRPYAYHDVPTDTAWDVYWKTLHAGCYPDGNEAQAKAKFEKWYKPFRDFRGLTDYAESVTKITESDAGIASKIVAGVGWFGKVVYKGTKLGFSMVSNRSVQQTDMLGVHRTMFKTERGYVGISSRHVKEGDAVALFKGGKMPFVLREQGDAKWDMKGDADALTTPAPGEQAAHDYFGSSVATATPGEHPADDYFGNTAGATA
ncbi:heterokaryon incompatibility protein-domain-containing protein [Apodospora peruviana]|uniref:Heterokaryon incompatibility protein-domain-containing protein n=1 Tax=Apodospora peruviana TaxID=516989 RepID=A0AAE0IL85_9PEZI|nr:heterokaryon incompatibility protein-domain-containing protein [Apodospora peruviana]